jgi:hypothetical protein
MQELYYSITVLEVPHVLTGIGIATNVANPFFAVPLSFLSHFALDKIPHWNPHFYTETMINGKPTKKSTNLAVADSLAALGVGLFFTYNSLPEPSQAVNVFLCSFASVLSDQIKIPYFYLGLRTGLLKKWVDFERSVQVDTDIYWGILTQLLVSFAALWWILV